MFSTSCVVFIVSVVSNVVAPSRMTKKDVMFSGSERNLAMINKCHVSKCVRSKSTRLAWPLGKLRTRFGICQVSCG